MRAAQISAAPRRSPRLQVDHKPSALTTIPAATLVDDRLPPSPECMRCVDVRGSSEAVEAQDPQGTPESVHYEPGPAVRGTACLALRRAPSMRLRSVLAVPL